MIPLLFLWVFLIQMKNISKGKPQLQLLCLCKRLIMRGVIALQNISLALAAIKSPKISFYSPLNTPLQL